MTPQEQKKEYEYLTSEVKRLIGESVEASPPVLAQIAVELSSYYFNFAEKLKDITIFKADRWMELRKEQKSDNSTDRLWDSTNKGKQEIELRSMLKGLEKHISNIKMRLKIEETASFGKF
jgi:hypothetical protein